MFSVRKEQIRKNGYPQAYSLFKGAQYESYTTLPAIDDFRQGFGLEDIVVVADFGFMISRNIGLLRSGWYKFIVGARIKKSGNLCVV